MRKRPLLAALAGVSLLTACDGLKEALTAHVDVAARAAGQELSVTRLAELIGNSPIGIPPERQTSEILASLWVNYQLAAAAAANGDSLTDGAAIDRATAPLTNNMRLRQFMEGVAQSWKPDSGSEAAYNAGAHRLYAARHILFGYPNGATYPGLATAAQRDSLRRRAEEVAPTITAENFAQMAARHSTEPGAGQRGGALGVFRREQMVQQFSDAVAGLRPGEVSKPVETQYGWHVIQRLPYSAVRSEHAQAHAQASVQSAESLYVASVDSQAKIELRGNVPALVKSIAADMPRYRKEDDVLATYRGGDLTAGEMVTWLLGFPPQQRIAQQIQQAPDSSLRFFVQNVARNQYLLERADSAGITVPAEERTQLQQEFGRLVQSVWQALGVAPAQLGDSAKTVEERRRLAAARVDAYLDRVMAGEAQPVNIPAPLEALLQDKYEWSIRSAGIDRATQRAQQLRATADSARAANQPRSGVPLPGAPGGAGAGQAPPPSPTPQQP